MGCDQSQLTRAVLLQESLNGSLAHPFPVVVVVVKACHPFNRSDQDISNHKGGVERRRGCVIRNNNKTTMAYEPACFFKDRPLLRGGFFVKSKLIITPSYVSSANGIFVASVSR